VKDLNPTTFLECSPMMCKITILENFQNVPYRKILQKSTMSSISEFLEIHKNLKYNEKKSKFFSITPYDECNYGKKKLKLI